MPVKTVAFVHVDARSARHALGFAETMVTNLAAHTISLGGHRKKGRKQSDCCSAEKYRAHFFLLITSRGNAFCSPLFRTRTSPGCNAQGHPSRTGSLAKVGREGLTNIPPTDRFSAMRVPAVVAGQLSSGRSEPPGDEVPYPQRTVSARLQLVNAPHSAL